MNSPIRSWPNIPDLDEERLLDLVAQIKDWKINHGLLLKQVRTESQHSVLCQPLGVSCFPSPFPRPQFDYALAIQETYNRLYCTVAQDAEWIFDAIKDLLPVDPLTRALWGIYEAAQEAGPVQQTSAGIFRSDYMPHVAKRDVAGSASASFGGGLKQVEFNTFSCAGASHANRVADMHAYLDRSGAYRMSESPVGNGTLPKNNNIESLASCLALAHEAYGSPRSSLAQRTAVLFVVQPNNFNIADERPIEYALWSQAKPVPAYRLTFGSDVLEYTWLSGERALLFHPPWFAPDDIVEISVVYMRAGYEAGDYDGIGYDARLRFEISAAIKCPSVLSHLTTFKKVQQALTTPGTLERFLSKQEAATIRRTFMPIHPLDESEDGLRARELACDPGQSVDYILKPSLEGGGHNIYGKAMPRFLASVPQSQWSRYILMERINPPISSNILMSSAGIRSGRVVSELGVLGCCMWKASPREPRCEVLHNSTSGWTFKTKFAEVDEMSVVKGYGCFDTPLLIDY